MPYIPTSAAKTIFLVIPTDIILQFSGRSCFENNVIKLHHAFLMTIYIRQQQVFHLRFSIVQTLLTALSRITPFLFILRVIE